MKSKRLNKIKNGIKKVHVLPLYSCTAHDIYTHATVCIYIWETKNEKKKKRTEEGEEKTRREREEREEWRRRERGSLPESRRSKQHVSIG